MYSCTTRTARDLALEDLLNRVTDADALLKDGKYTLEEAWHMVTCQAERIQRMTSES